MFETSKSESASNDAFDVVRDSGDPPEGVPEFGQQREAAFAAGVGMVEQAASWHQGGIKKVPPQAGFVCSHMCGSTSGSGSIIPLSNLNNLQAMVATAGKPDYTIMEVRGKSHSTIGDLIDIMTLRRKRHE